MLEQQEKNSEQSYSSDYCRYKTLFESINAAAFITSLDGKIIDSNLKSHDLFGYDCEELNNFPLNNMFSDKTDWSQLLEEIISKGGMNFESENKRKDGSIFPVIIDTSLFKLDGKPTLLVLVWDITERKKAERLLIESEEKFRGLFNCTTDGMLILDSRGEIFDVNSQILKFFGLTKEKMVGINLFNMHILTPKSISIVLNQFQNLLFNKTATSQETELIDKDGKIVDVELTSFFLLKKQNELNNFVLLIRDIRDRKQAEIKITREHSLLKTLMDSSPDSIYFKDEENKFIKVNKTKASHSNVKPEEMIGKTDYDFLPEDEAKKSFEDDEEILKTGKFIINKIEKLTNIDGSEKLVSVTKIPRFDAEGNIIGTMGISRDITEWKRLEELENKDKNS